MFVESIGNPRGNVTDIAAIAEVAHAAGVPLIVDNTVATPFLLRPFEHGADIYGVSRHRTHPAVPRNACFCRCS